MEHYLNSNGFVVTSAYTRINISVNGAGREVILIFARKTSPSPIIEMKSLVHFLEDKYTVVTFDYLGSGFSDNYHCERTLDNITNEIHEVMEVLGYTSYTICAQAYAGLYSLYYANKYSNEVKAVVEIDTFVPEQRDNKTHEDNVKLCNYMWLDYHKSRLLQWIVEKAAMHYLKKSKSFKYDLDSIENYANSAAFMLEQIALLDEYKCPDENFDKLRNICFPTHIPVLCILSSYRGRKFRSWYDLHKKQLLNCNSKIITLKGGKNLHLTHSKKLSQEIDSFLTQ